MDYTLTVAERAVVVLIAHGRSNAEVADELGLSVETVKTHMQRIGTRWGIRGERASIVGAAYRNGVLGEVEDEWVARLRVNGYVVENQPEFDGDRRRTTRDRRGRPKNPPRGEQTTSPT